MSELAEGTPSPPTSPFETTQRLGRDLRQLARAHDLPDDDVVVALSAIVTRLATEPNSIFPEPSEYVRDCVGPATAASPARSTHAFFDVVAARASRRDFGTDPLDLSRLQGLLHWTVGVRASTTAYDWRNAPQRFVASAGGLASMDAYVIANNVTDLEHGAYYFDYRRGFVRVSRGFMAQRLADLMPGQTWLSRAAAVVVFVANTQRVSHKYAEMAFKLMMLDAGVAVGHAELVATALELRSTVLGGLPADQLSALLRLDNRTRVPIVTLAVGTRSGHE